jgi:hypothetical protein
LRLNGGPKSPIFRKALTSQCCPTMICGHEVPGAERNDECSDSLNDLGMTALERRLSNTD